MSHTEIEKIKLIIKKLPHSEHRVPYTYHHDYLRIHKFKEASRSDIAQLKNWTDIELWSTAFVSLVESIGIFAILDSLNNEDVKCLKKAKQITQTYIETQIN